MHTRRMISWLAFCFCLLVRYAAVLHARLGLAFSNPMQVCVHPPSYCQYRCRGAHSLHSFIVPLWCTQLSCRKMQVKEDVLAKVKDAGGTGSTGNGNSAVSQICLRMHKFRES